MFDKITRLPSGETASTFPVTVVTLETVGGLLLGSRIINPLSLPKYALVPSELNTNEFGVAGNCTPCESVLVGTAMGNRNVVQPKLAPQPVVVANAVVGCPPVVVVGVTCTATAAFA